MMERGKADHYLQRITKLCGHKEFSLLAAIMSTALLLTACGKNALQDVSSSLPEQTPSSEEIHLETELPATVPENTAIPSPTVSPESKVEHGTEKYPVDPQANIDVDHAHVRFRDYLSTGEYLALVDDLAEKYAETYFGIGDSTMEELRAEFQCKVEMLYYDVNQDGVDEMILHYNCAQLIERPFVVFSYDEATDQVCRISMFMSDYSIDYCAPQLALVSNFHGRFPQYDYYTMANDVTQPMLHTAMVSFQPGPNRENPEEGRTIAIYRPDESGNMVLVSQSEDYNEEEFGTTEFLFFESIE